MTRWSHYLAPIETRPRAGDPVIVFEPGTGFHGSSKMRVRFRFLLATATLAVALVAGAVPVAANVAGDSEGCTPGYWKNHTEVWQEFTPVQTIGSVFTGAPAAFSSLTLEQGLALRGGPRIAGAQQILLRAAIASLLNAAYDSPDGSHLLFPWRRNDPGFNGEPPLISHGQRRPDEWQPDDHPVAGELARRRQQPRLPALSQAAHDNQGRALRVRPSPFQVSAPSSVPTRLRPGAAGARPRTRERPRAGPCWRPGRG